MEEQPARRSFPMDITSYDMQLTSDQILLSPAETVIQEEESHWAEDQPRNES